MAHDDVAATTKIRLAHHTLSGCRHGQRPPHSLLARADAAHQAGVHEIGACADDLGMWDPHELRYLLRGHHVKVRELEWVDLAEPDRDAEDALYRLAGILKARQLNVGVCSPSTFPDGYLIKRLREVARRAAEHHLTVAFEPVVFGSVGDVTRVQHLIVAAAEPNVGVLLDVYHMARTCWDSLRDVDPDLVAAIQINGISRVRPIPSWPQGLLQEAQCGRLMPDEGDFPVAEWLAMLRAKGVDPSRVRLSSEILSDTQRARPILDAAKVAADAAHKFAALWEAM